ncbi:PGPGW domain-containing protein [Cellulomonas hominis]|uniref:PGPGW domain-containing protein n=1 Tax=Cellulomonas hominis TaxID=156981 RepID=UPI001BA0B089|nr:PGPGW domain-containing protein [Cellulomonas hominis]VTR77884.1 hypothetical protein CHMI_02659 [Cellulomonas hominis]
MPDDSLAAEIAAGERTDTGAHRALARLRARLDSKPWLRLTYKVVVTVVGGSVVAVGIALLVLPGPGWLLIFLGLGILGTEFPAVRRLTDRFKAFVMRVWQSWRDRRARRRGEGAG